MAVHSLFDDNKKTHEVYLVEEFHNVKQGDLSAGDNLKRKKAMTDFDLVTNIIKGLDEHFNSVTDIAPLLMPFSTFLNFLNMQLLQEMKVARRTANTLASALHGQWPRAPPPAGGGAPPGAGDGKHWRPQPPPNPHYGGYDKN
jgi:hypothetical protein